ncbi:MAG: 50S ribosomal protein L30 [Gemmatimonadota bacterium]|nr:50S ribosomal protein L30 [Gemmatimonadota bacterium]
MPRTFVWHPSRGPKTTLKDVAPGTGRVRIEQIKSGINQPRVQKRTLEAIGLKHHQDIVIKQDSPGLRGQIKRVRHLIRVTPAEE